MSDDGMTGAIVTATGMGDTLNEIGMLSSFVA
jgi:hypothetical protein